MNVTVKLLASLRDHVISDLIRPHPFAYERIGFISAIVGNRTGKNPQVFLADYLPVPDDRYIEDSKVGARIDSAAIRMAMQYVLDNPGKGVFHVHLHDWNGQPGFSATDRREIPPIVESCRNVAANEAHGMLVFSRDKADCTVWWPGSLPVPANRISVIGHPLRFLEK
ncbi:MAG TPA: hypothetical protein PLK77_16025 [Pyrinomonadaceae bacterium]|nr:hypothetical protein [Pyrinomonadaceae bacterium]